ncbi:MAG: fumarylacetoacetate hydrolase family protein [Pseudomonadota bacterium]
MTTSDNLASRLRGAYDGQTVAPMRDGLMPNDADTAYEIQALNTQFWVDQGRKIVGRKIGLTSPAVQKQLGVDQPDFGVLFDDMAVTDGESVGSSRLIQPKVEAEVALVLAKDLNEIDCTAEHVADAIDYAVTAIEIVDSRIADWKITFADTVADNGSSALFVLGKDKKPLTGLDLYSCGMVLEINGEITSIGAGAACLGHPLNAAAWLASTLSKHGAGLKAGDILMTGALGPMVPLTPGDRVTAHIGGLGSCSFSYA